MPRPILGSFWGTLPRIDLLDDHELHRCLQALSEAAVIHSARDISDGGLAVTLSEASFANGIGADISLHPFSADSPYPDACRLFAEETTQVVVTCDEDQVGKLRKIADEFGFVTVIPIGRTVGNHIAIRVGDQLLTSESVEELKRSWSSSLESTLHDNTANEVFA